jgi:hypothetical protein
MGGTLFLTKSLVYRTVHPDNAYLVNRIISTHNMRGKYDGPAHSRKVREDALEAIRANGGEAYLQYLPAPETPPETAPEPLPETQPEAQADVQPLAPPEAPLEAPPRVRRRRSVLARWRRSFEKRWSKMAAAFGG